MLERLLSLAPDLSSEGEVTPIQAWNIIRCRPDFGGLDTRSLSALARKLKKAVKCHGYANYPKLHVRMKSLTVIDSVPLLKSLFLRVWCMKR